MERLALVLAVALVAMGGALAWALYRLRLWRIKAEALLSESGDRPDEAMICLKAMPAAPALPGDLECTMVNGAAAALLGLPVGFSRGITLGGALPEWRALIIPRLVRALADGRPDHIEADLPHPEGGRRNLRLQVERRDDMLVVMVKDRSGHSSTQKILSQREAHLRLVLETIFDGVVVLDDRGRIVAANAAMTRLFGFAPSELGGKRLSELMPELEDTDSSTQSGRPRMLYDADKHLIGTARELDGVRKDGSKVHVELSICEGDREAERVFVGVIHDISDRLKAEAEVRQAGDLLRQVIDTAPNVITLKDAEGRYLLVNLAAAELLGRRPDKIVGHHLKDLMADAAEAERINAEDWEIAASGRPLDVERPVTAASGGRRWFRTNKRIITLTDSRVGVLSVNTDITELREAMERIETAKAEVESLHRAQSSFMAGLSHEVRTPLNGVLGMAEVLLQSGLTPEQTDYVRTLHRAGESLLVLLNDILDFTKIEAGRLEVERIPFDLGVVVHDVMELFRPRVAGGTVDLLVDLGPNLPRHVLGDPGRLRQIIANLVSNAVKFTRAGHVLVSVRREDQGEDGRWWYAITVEDTGIGISTAGISKLFSPFQQAETSTSRRYGGTGLGLAICRKLSGLMGGAITVTSSEGKGSCFTLRLPLANHDRPSAASVVPALPPGLRVLVVEDHELTQRILVDMLTEAGLAAESIGNAGEALAALGGAVAAGQPFDAALIDDELPGFRGEELATMIRSDASLANTRLIQLSSSPRRGDAARSAQAGFVGFLAKPVRAEVLLGALATVLADDWDGSAGLVTRHTIAEAQAQAAQHQRQALPAMKVLVVEDNEINQRVLGAMLAHLKVTTATAEDGRVAIDRLVEEHFDVVLMDCHMPHMDGFEAVAELRRREQESKSDRHRVVIALTGDAQEGDRERCLEAGMDDYLTKPVSEAALHAALERWIRPRG